MTLTGVLLGKRDMEFMYLKNKSENEPDLHLHHVMFHLRGGTIESLTGLVVIQTNIAISKQ